MSQRDAEGRALLISARRAHCGPLCGTFKAQPGMASNRPALPGRAGARVGGEALLKAFFIF